MNKMLTGEEFEQSVRELARRHASRPHLRFANGCWWCGIKVGEDLEDCWSGSSPEEAYSGWLNSACS